MISKALFVAKIQDEVRILKHLTSKATTPELLNFRFSDKQRTTLEWMGYIAVIGSIAAQDICNDDPSGWESFTTRMNEVTADTFNTIIDADIAKMIAIINDTSEEKFTENKTMRGSQHDTRAGHMLSIHNLYVAYKTQIFLQLKAAGLSELGTMNLWAGIDAPQKSDEATA